MSRVLKLALALCAVALAPRALAQGMLMPTLPGQERPLPVAQQTVTVSVQDGTAVTRVTQVFVNRSPRPLEATYMFPLPAGAALADFSLEIGGHMQRGEVVAANRAREVYENIVRQLRDPGLLEYVDRDLFRARVFPVPANGTQRIELAFSQVLTQDHGLYRYTYPLGALRSATLVDNANVAFEAKIDSKAAVHAIYSPTHRLGIRRKGDHEARVGLEGSAAEIGAKDLDLYYAVDAKAIGLNLLTFKKDAGDAGYFIAMISPRQEGVPEIAKTVTLVVDTSGSMQGVKMEQAKSALRYVLGRLGKGDLVNVIRFSTDTETLWDEPRPATKENVRKANEFVDGLEALGGTAIDDALTRALADGAGSAARPHLVLFITDGQPTVGETSETAILAHARAATGHTRLFTFGVGTDLNAKLLDAMAEADRGASDYARDGEVEKVISGFYDKVAHPVLADLSLELGDVGAYDVYPRRLPDLFTGGEVVVVGRYRKPGNTAVKLVGQVDGAPVGGVEQAASMSKAFAYDASFPAEEKDHDFIPRLWAVRKVGFLLDEIRKNGERPELRDAVTKLGVKYGIVTPYTSYLAIESEGLINAHGQPLPPPRDFERRTPPMADAAPAAAPAPSGPGFFDRVRSAFGGGSAQALAGEPDEEKPAKRESPKHEHLKDFASGGGRAADAPAEMADTGEAGVDVSKAIKGYKESDKVALAGEPVRTAGGRTFILRDGGWVDTGARPGMKEIKVKALSDGYFDWLKKKPELKEAFALGQKVSVVVDGALLIVAP